jgi:hypothetical protein
VSATFYILYYGGWKNLAPWMVKTCLNPINNGINHLSTGAGLLHHPQYLKILQGMFSANDWMDKVKLLFCSQPDWYN